MEHLKEALDETPLEEAPTGTGEASPEAAVAPRTVPLTAELIAVAARCASQLFEDVDLR